MAKSPDTRGERTPSPSVATLPQSERSEERRRRIAESAYYRAERRGFAPGLEEDDWYEAEKEVDRGTPTDKKPEANDFPSPK